VLYILFAASLASLVLIVERWAFYRTVDADLRSLAEQLDARLSRGDFDGAVAELSQSRSVAAAVAAAGLRLAPRGTHAADKAMQSAVALQRARLDRWLAYLGTLGNNAPFVGLLGTVIGVVEAFAALGQQKGGLGVAANSAGLMASIGEALVATAVGILVALPAVAAYNYFQRRVASLLQGTEVLTNLVLAYLSDGTAPGPHSSDRAESESPRNTGTR
jgi:biopolymer transport protein ExbB